MALTAEHDYARQASRQCARTCGALTRVRRGILKNTRDFTAPGAGKEHTSEVRGGGRDPGVRRPGSGLGRPTARSLPVPCECGRQCSEMQPMTTVEQVRNLRACTRIYLRPIITIRHWRVERQWR